MPATLADLEARVVALEQPAAGRATQLSANYLTIDPATGAIGANFTGHIHGQGLDLDAATNPTPPTSDKVRWLAAGGGLVAAEIAAFRGVGGQDELDLTVNPGLNDPAGTIELRTFGYDSVTLRSAKIDVQASQFDATTNIIAQAIGAAGTHGVTIVDAAGRSTFPQINAAGDPVYSAAGVTSLTFAAGATESSAVNLTPPAGATVAIGGLACNMTYEGRLIVAQMINGTTFFQLLANTSAAFGVATTIKVAWLAWFT